MDTGAALAEREQTSDLIEALARDLDGAFERLVMSQQDRLYTIAVRMLGDARDGEEVAQDAFVRAYRALAAYEPDRIRDLQLRPWLTTIVINLCRNRVRRHSPQTQPLERNGHDLADVEPALVARDHRDSPHESALRRESAQRWAELVAGLPPLYRAAVVLRHVDGLSYAEMSAALGRPEGTLKAQVHRGLALLRAALERADARDRQELSA